MTLEEARNKIREAEQAIETIISKLESDGLNIRDLEINRRLKLPDMPPQCKYAIKIKVEI